MRPLSVVHVISSPWWTGAAEPALFLAADLAARGHRVRFLCGPGEALEARAERLGFPQAPDLDPTRSLNPWRVGRFVRRLAGMLEEAETDILHAHLSADHWLSLPALRLCRRPVRLVRTVHHPRAVKGNPFTRFLLNGAAAVIAPNSHIARVLADRAALPPERLHVVPGAVDLGRFAPPPAEAREKGRAILGQAPGTPLVGIVSRLAPDRGHFLLFDAFRQVAREVPGARLAVVGKGEFLPRLRSRVRDLGLEDWVDFPGYHEEDLPEVLAALDLFALMAPGSEGSCRAVLEAMAVGLPCVVTDRNGLADTVEDGVTARVVPDGDASRLAAALRELLADEGLRRAYGRAGRRRVEAHFTRERRAERVEEIYLKLLDPSLAISYAGERS
ncbi:MAG: glycosyltransferase family 4 protein [Candidatus Tectomicrobia bacterium]|uniref:Glycosyltransferase family 4 protein n=1 Tax=Tectimicrobiota bacterium TaxID=2528274 RepID=A0A932I0T2_UNCTE|nr:glycosyltransferase family 4 protein [Candidatus Tectomicrobia bacterium]